MPPVCSAELRREQRKEHHETTALVQTRLTQGLNVSKRVVGQNMPW